MAKFLSQVYTSIRGKVGGIVYTKNAFAGLVARAFTAPTNPGTEGQALIRTCFSEASNVWKQGLSDAQRDAWNNYSATLEYEGPHGTYKLPGRQVMISNFGLALYLEQIGGSSISVDETAPVTAGFEGVGAIASATFTTASATGIAFSVGNPNAYDLSLLVQRSVAYTDSKNTFRGPWVWSYNLGETATASSTSTIEIETGGTAGDIWFVRVRPITENGPHKIAMPVILRLVSVTNP